MRPLLVFPILALAAPALAGGRPADLPIREVAAGSGLTCVRTDESVRCFGTNVHGQAEAPPLRQPRNVSIGGAHVCGLDADGVKCWGYNSHGQATVPRLKNPRQISAGGQHTCALDDEGVKCWGDNGDRQVKVPPLRNPRMVSAGGRQTCALDDDGVTCWGLRGPTSLPPLSDPTQVSVGKFHACALHRHGVTCWNEPRRGTRGPWTKMSALSGVKQLSAGGAHTCALDEQGVKCWGDPSYGALRVPPLRQPTAVAAGHGHTCALHERGLECWGLNSEGQLGEPGPKVKEAEVEHRHAATAGSLPPAVRKAVESRFPLSAIMGVCQGRFDRGSGHAITLLLPPGGKKLRDVVRLAVTEGGDVWPVGEPDWTLCTGGECFVGETLCLPPGETKAFLAEHGEAFLESKRAAPRGRDALCFSTSDVYDNWDCYAYDAGSKRFARWYHKAVAD